MEEKVSIEEMLKLELEIHDPDLPPIVVPVVM